MSLALCLSPVADGLANGCAAYGRFASKGRTPVVLMVVSLIVAGGLSVGMIEQTVNNDAQEIFTPITSKAKDDDARIAQVYPAANSSSSGEFLLRLPSGGNVWSAAAVHTLERVWNHTLALRVTLSTGTVIQLQDICTPGLYGGCQRFIASDCLSQTDRAGFASVGTSAAAGAAAGAAPAVPLVSTANRLCVRGEDGAFLFVPTSSGTDVTVQPGTPDAQQYPWAGAQLTHSSSLGMAFSFASSSTRQSLAEPQLTEETVSTEYQQAWLDAAKEWQVEAEAEGWQAAFATELSAELALEASTNGDILLVVIAIVLLVNFAIFSGASCDCVRSRHAVAVGGVAAVALAIPATFGLMALAGVPYVATIGVVPFLLLAIGVDSSFVIVSAVNRRHSSEPVVTRIGHALHEAGPAITLTTATDVIAFVIGAVTSPFRAVTYFCLYTGVALGIGLVFILTIFIPLLAFDAAREANGRSALTCCPVPGRSSVEQPAADKANGKATSTEAGSQGSTAAVGGEAELASRGAMSHGKGNAADGKSTALGGSAVAMQSRAALAARKGDEEEEEDGDDDVEVNAYQGRCCDMAMGNGLAPVVTSRWGVVIISVVWLALVGASGYGFSRVEQGLELSQLALDGDPFVRYSKWNVAYFSLGFPFNVFTDAHAPVDLADGQLREALRLLPKRIDALEEDVTAAPDSFFDTLAATLGADANATVSEAQIDAVLQQLLGDPVVRNQFDGTVRWARVPAVGSSEDLPLQDGFLRARDALAAGDRVLVRSALYVVRTRSLSESLEQAEAMVGTREAAEKAVRQLEPTPGRLGVAVVQFEAFPFFEADVVLPTATYTSLALGIAAIAVVSLLLLPHLAAVLIVVVAVASIDLMLLASLPVFGIKLSTISGINLLLAIGLSVDAVAHITHAFIHAREPLVAARAMVTWPLMEADDPACCGGLFCGAERRRRAVASVLVMARPVMQGSLSSLLGLVTLAFSASYIFRVFCIILSTTLILAILHALIVVPVLLTIMGPIMDDGHDVAAVKQASTSDKAPSSAATSA